MLTFSKKKLMEERIEKLEHKVQKLTNLILEFHSSAEVSDSDSSSSSPKSCPRHIDCPSPPANYDCYCGKTPYCDCDRCKQWIRYRKKGSWWRRN